jgi:hypothetical protein
VSSVIVIADISGSTEAKLVLNKTIAIQRIKAALDSVRDALCKADPDLRCLVPYAGDAMLMVGGTKIVDLYHAAVIHQSSFKAWPEGRLPIKLTLGYGDFDVMRGNDGVETYHSSDLDFVANVNNWCPAGGLLVTQPMFALLNEAGLGHRFHKVKERVKGFSGLSTFYESNGNYKIPRDRRQPFKERLLKFKMRWKYVAALLAVGLVLISVAIVIANSY